jgi:hypothetical protein
VKFVGGTGMIDKNTYMIILFCIVITIAYIVPPTISDIPSLNSQKNTESHTNLTGLTTTSNSINGVQIFPDDHIWNVPVDTLSVDPRSSDYIKKIGITTSLHPDFGAMWEGSTIGIPYNVVSGTQQKKTVSFDYADESDPGPYPIPDNPLIEGGSDAHILIIDQDAKKLYELYAAA